MNFNISIKCGTCETQTNCRLGLSNRPIQPLRFRCAECGTPINITMVPDFEAIKVDIQVENAIQIETEEFKKEVNFVDLHVDFPVLFGEYAMGMTPFIVASRQIGFQAMQIHKARLSYLNQIYEHVKDISDIFTLYKTEKFDIFKTKALAFLESNMACQTPLDRNRALYFVIAKAFSPFAEPGRSMDSVSLFTQVLIELDSKDKNHLFDFFNTIVSNKFLQNIQADCLEIYPRILNIELMLRPALFLDFDKKYKENQIAYRVSTHDFLDVKDLYKDILEIISRAIVLVAAINNFQKRGDYNKFPSISNAPNNLDKFADIPLGKKLDYIDSNWYPIEEHIIDNQLRNAVAHHKIEYNEITQEISYFPKKEGIKQEQSEIMFFLDFTRKILEAFRELHQLNHLIKCLFYYYHLKILNEKGTPCDIVHMT